MRTINITVQFKKDWKREIKGRHRQILEADFSTIIGLLAKDAELPLRLHDHALSGNWKDHRDLHIKPDLLLIYRKSNESALDLVRLGSHSALGL
jgi:mRNA interferase YafQ